MHGLLNVALSAGPLSSEAVLQLPLEVGPVQLGPWLVQQPWLAAASGGLGALVLQADSMLPFLHQQPCLHHLLLTDGGRRATRLPGQTC